MTLDTLWVIWVLGYISIVLITKVRKAEVLNIIRKTKFKFDQINLRATAKNCWTLIVFI